MSDNDKLGRIITGEEEKDAIHVAIAPVIALETLMPGQHIGLVKDTTDIATANVEPLGIVDPFLNGQINKGEKFFMVLYPNTIKGMRHAWVHPSFTPELVAKSVAWLQWFADELKIDYDDLIEGAKDFINDGQYYIFRFDTPDFCSAHAEEMWKHLSNVLTIEIPDHLKEYTFFSCSC